MLIVGHGLVTIHYAAPAGIKSQLVFDHERFAPWTVLTAAYVHASTRHLMSNLVGYWVSGGIVYWLCSAQGRQRWFWRTTILFLVALPILVNLTSYGMFQSLELIVTTRGFSGVVAGNVGFILVALSRWLADRHDYQLGMTVGQILFVLLLGEIALIYVGHPSLVMLALFGAAFTLSIGRLLQRGLQQTPTPAERQQVALEAAFVTAITAMLATFIWMLFPAQIVQHGNQVDIIGHAAGFLWGVVLAGLTIVPTSGFQERLDVSV